MSFFGDLFGGKSGINASNNAAEAAAAYASAGGKKYREEVGKGYTSADNTLSGYEAAYGGQQGARLYSDSLGINGAEGGQRAQAAYQAGRNPYLAYEQQQAVDLLNRKNNAGGMRWSGTNALAGARASMGLGYQDNQAWQNRLQGNAQMAGAYGQQRAGNAVAQGQDMGNSWQNQNNALANIETNRQMGIAQAKAQGMNNLMSGIGGLAGFAISGFAPGAKGGSAFGNMANALGGR